MKKIKKMFTLYAGIAALLCGCSQIDIENNNLTGHNEVGIPNLNSEIVLGEKIHNPFTVTEVQARSAAGTEITANYIYFRCRTKNQEELKWLSETNEIMSIIPLDREIVEGGFYYKDPDVKEGEARWYYFVKSVEEFTELKSHQIETEIIEEMYFDDEDYALLTGEGLDIPEDGYLTVDAENCARSLWSKIKKFIKKYVANTPRGKVTVYDAVTDSYVPVKNVQVITSQLLVISMDHTDSNGRFSIPIAYTSLGGKVQVLLRFQNAGITIKDIDADVDAALGTIFTDSVVYYEGSHWIEGISNLKINLDKHNKAAKYATVMNAYADFIDFCEEYDMVKPAPLNVVVNSKIQNSCATLCRYGGRELIMTAAATLEPVLGLTITGALLPLMPDIIIGTKNHANLEKTYSATLHELSHATHYFGLGTNGKEVWIREYYDMLSGWGKMIAEGRSPFEDCYNNGGTDLIKLIESWGYFSENYLMWQRYDSLNLGNSYKDTLEKRTLFGNSKQFFYYGGFYDLTDNINTDELEIDLCEGFEYTDIYNAIISSNVDSITTFAKVLTENTNRKDEYENVINTLERNHD